MNTVLKHSAYTLKTFIPQLLSRKKRPGLFITSSMSAHYPITGFLAYSACKVFLSYLGIGLYYELRDKVDVTVLEPLFVASKITKL